MMRDYSGMTMNERLWASGRMNEFDQALIKRDKEHLIKIYKELGVIETAEQDVDTLLKERTRQ